MKSAQRGISLIGFIFVGIVLACVVVVGAQVLPTVIEYQTILKTVNKVADEGGSIPELRKSFDRAQVIEGFNAISAKDLEISISGERAKISFEYQKEIHLAGPAYLLLKYAGTSR